MVRLKFAEALAGVDAESDTPRVNLVIPAAVGVPDITPVLAARVIPAGRAVPPLRL